MRIKLSLGILLILCTLLLAGIFSHSLAYGANKHIKDYNVLLAQFKASGATVRPQHATHAFQPFSVPAHQIMINKGVVDVLVYRDSKSAAAEAATISPKGFIIGNAIMEGNLQPHFYRSERFILFYNGNDPTILHILMQVVGKQIAGV